MSLHTNCETTPLKEQKGSEQVTSRDVRLVASSFFCITGIVAGTYYYGPLMSSFESDTSLGWTSADTALLASVANAANCCGHLLAGPLADYIPPVLLLMVEATMTILGMIWVSMSLGKVHVIVGISVVTFAKGTMWPSIGAMLAANMARSKHDIAFLASSLGGRVADMTSATVLTACMQQLGLPWQHAVLSLMSVNIILFVVAFGSGSRDMELATNLLQQRPHESNLSVAAKWGRFLVDQDCWYALLANLGSYSIWSLYDYLSVLFTDRYHLSAGVAAGETAWVSFGSVVGLLVAFAASWKFSSDTSRFLHVVQSVFAVLALLALSASDNIALNTANALLVLLGFGFIVPAYMPLLQLGASSNSEERAFRTATIDGVSTVIALSFTVTYGVLREQQRLTAIYHFATVWMIVSTVALARFYQRLAVKDSAVPPVQRLQERVPDEI